MKSNFSLSAELMDVTLVLIEVLKAECKAVASLSGPTLTQFKILYAIDDGANQVGKISEAFGISQPAASKIVDHLVKEEWLDRLSHPNDRRQIDLVLTAKARSSIQRMTKRAEKKIDQKLSLLFSEAQKSKLAREIHQLKSVLSAGGEVKNIEKVANLNVTKSPKKAIRFKKSEPSQVVSGVVTRLGKAAALATFLFMLQNNSAHADGSNMTAGGSPVAGSNLTVEQYINQVQGSNDGVQGSNTTAHADQNASEEGGLVYSPQLFGSFNFTDDYRQTLVPAFQGDRTVTDGGQVGVKKLFDFGLQSQLYYSINRTALYGIDPDLVPQSSLETSALTFQFTQALWQNGFGKTDAAQAKAIEQQDLAYAFSASYDVKTRIADAESKYWALAVARETVRIHKESADRTNTIRDFNKKRVRSHLIDEADLLTSDAQARSEQYELKNAIDNERVAARAFNSVRGVDADEVPDQLSLPDPQVLVTIQAPTRGDMRDDVKSAEQTELAVTSNSVVATQKQQPMLNFVGTLSTNGLDASLPTSVKDTATTNYPYYSLGLNFSMPLDLGTVSTVKKAYADQAKGAAMTFRRKLFDQENDWKDLVRKLAEAKERLLLAVDVEKAQQLKYQHETTRQKQGLTTTYQVFQFDIDYLNSELTRVQTQGTILNLVAQMKTYRSGL